MPTDNAFSATLLWIAAGRSPMRPTISWASP